MMLKFSSLTKFFLVTLTLLPLLGGVTVSTVVASEWSARQFGHRGSDGTAGRSGRDGRNGRDLTLLGEDNFGVNLDLSGENGGDGEDGEPGYAARCHWSSGDHDYHLRGADGGRGGNGGRGGRGGNGGSLTVYYTRREDLRRIVVRSQGGEGGRGGRGGAGGEGCRCFRRRWQIQKCTGTPGTPDYKCTTQEYRCYDGRYGDRGREGSSGDRGSLGTLSLINRREPIAGDTPTRSLSLAELAQGPVALSLNRWQSQRGAQALLGNGSIIADEYREFVDRLEASFQLVWQESRPLANFADQPVRLVLDESRRIRLESPPELWLEATDRVQDGRTILTVTNALRQSETTQLQVSDVGQSGSDLNLKLVDRGGRAHLLKTRFWLRYRATERFDRVARPLSQEVLYEGEVPAQLVTQDTNRYILAIGKLPIDADALRPGTQVDLEVVATRTFAGRTAEQRISWQTQIRG